MITRDNLTEVFNLINEEQIKQVFSTKNDYVSLYIDGYGNVFFDSIDINDEERENEILSAGGIICDKDDFLRLFEESGSLNPFLIELI